MPRILDEDVAVKITSTEILAQNLRTLRDRPGMPKAQMAIALKAGIDQRTVGRTLNCTHQAQMTTDTC